MGRDPHFIIEVFDEYEYEWTMKAYFNRLTRCTLCFNEYFDYNGLPEDMSLEAKWLMKGLEVVGYALEGFSYVLLSELEKSLKHEHEYNFPWTEVLEFARKLAKECEGKNVRIIAFYDY